MTPNILDALTQAVGSAYVLTDEADLTRYGIDRTTLWQAAPAVVVLPASTAEVQALVKVAIEHQMAIVPSGGRTGLSGGAVAQHGEMVIALDRMNTVREFDPIDRTVTVDAGMITANLQAFAESRQLFYAVDFASSGSSQIGGNIATNAGGIKVIRYGMTREQILGLEVVDGHGNCMQLNRGLLKNNSGLDLRHLMIGSEGILGIITAATIRLHAPPMESVVMVLGTEQFRDVVTVLDAFNASMQLSAFEFFSHNALERVTEHMNLQPPFMTSTPFYALLEFDKADEDRAMTLFEQLLEQGGVTEGVVSRSLSQARELWRLREDISETLSRWKPYKNDISVRVSRIQDFIVEVERLIDTVDVGMEVVWYGHIGDGNLHLNILKAEHQDQASFRQACTRFSERLADLLMRFEGSISAEHGVGLLKKAYLGSTRSEQEISLMKQIKQVFDPHGVMNPGKVFD